MDSSSRNKLLAAVVLLFCAAGWWFVVGSAEEPEPARLGQQTQPSVGDGAATADTAKQGSRKKRKSAPPPSRISEDIG